MKSIMMTYRRDDAHLRVGEDFPEIGMKAVWSAAELADNLPGAEILLLNNRICEPDVGAAIRANARGLRWIQFISSGVERGREIGLPAGVPVTNSSGVKGPVIAEHAMTLLLALARRVPDFVDARKAGKWIRLDVHSKMWGAEGKTLVIIGMGAIGHEIARKAKAFDMHVIGVSRAGKPGDNFDEVMGREHLREALARADAAVVCLPSDADTYHMIGAQELKALGPKGFFVNVARGEIVDEEALAAALAAKQIAGAALDVTDPEPLKPGSPLWTVDNVLLSPHVAGGGSTGYERFRELFADNLRRYRAGEPLRNLVPMN